MNIINNKSKKKRNTRVIAIAAIYTYYLKSLSNYESKTYIRSEWVKKWKTDRNMFGHMPLVRELKENYPDDYRNYLRMDAETFDKLLSLIKHKIVKQDTIMRQSISAEERLAATLRYLATGRSFKDLSFSTGIGTSTLCNLIPETCQAIYESLQGEYMKVNKIIMHVI